MTLFAAATGAVAVYLVVLAVLNRRRPQVVRARPPKAVKESLADRLRLAGAGISPARYRATVAVSVATAFSVAVVITGTVPLAVAAGAAVGAAPRMFYRRRRDQILAARIAAWPEAIRDVLSQLGTGQTLHRSLTALGAAGPLALRPTFARYDANALALDIPTALELARAELSDPVSDKVIETLLAAHERGREVIMSVLRGLADNVARDVQLRETITTGHQNIRRQAAIAVAMPFLLLAYLITSNVAYASFYRSPGGWIVIAIGVVMAAIGWTWISALGRIPEEPRVLTGRRSS